MSPSYRYIITPMLGCLLSEKRLSVCLNVNTNHGLSATVEPPHSLISLKPSSIAHDHHTFIPVLAYYSEWTILLVYCPAPPADKLACCYQPNKLSFKIILVEMDI